ncbi:DUF6199 family natural product biosynthesis protein [Paenibacillus sp. FSL K6-1096]|uniref:DUF6199 family natural product biosynthesis protein n=1 Tax=Paenibacillus sp. FSL K6-1096 TaxID=2921460 RepID=UPI0030EB347A
MTGLIGFIIVAIGLVIAVWPKAAWYLRLGWRFKNAEPSGLALGAERVTGVILVIAGFILMVSSCASGSADRHWAERFKEKLDSGQVQEISIGLINPAVLSGEETTKMIQMIQDAELRPFDSGNSFGASNTGTITFTDQTRVDIVILGPTGGIELHPDDTQTDYEIMSEELKTWLANYGN